MKLAEEGKINEAENELYMGMVEDDVDYLELALTFYLYLNDMDGDFWMITDIQGRKFWKV